MVTDPRLQPVPEDPIERAHALARDLAYGALVGEWSRLVNVSLGADGLEHWSIPSGTFEQIENQSRFLQEKWDKHYPPISLLITHSLLQNEGSPYHYRLTDKAMSLVRPPSVSPTV